MEDMRGKNKSKDKLKAYLGAVITSLFGSILDYCEIGVGDKERMKALRSKILKLSNDSIRSISKEVDEKYRVEYVPPTEDVIVVGVKK